MNFFKRKKRGVPRFENPPPPPQRKNVCAMDVDNGLHLIVELMDSGAMISHKKYLEGKLYETAHCVSKDEHGGNYIVEKTVSDFMKNIYEDMYYLDRKSATIKIELKDMRNQQLS